MSDGMVEQIVLVSFSVAVGWSYPLLEAKLHCTTALTVHRSISMTMAVPGQTPTPIVCLLAGSMVGMGRECGLPFR